MLVWHIAVVFSILWKKNGKRLTRSGDLLFLVKAIFLQAISTVRHHGLVKVFRWRFPPSSCTPLCSLSLSLSPLPAEGADSPWIPGL